MCLYRDGKCLYLHRVDVFPGDTPSAEYDSQGSDSSGSTTESTKQELAKFLAKRKGERNRARQTRPASSAAKKSIAVVLGKSQQMMNASLLPGTNSSDKLAVEDYCKFSDEEVADS